MKNTIYNTSKNILLLFAAAILMTACKKNEDAPLEAPRLFKASDIKVTVAETSAKITWSAPLFANGKALSYTVDFSKDQAFTTIAFTKQVDTTGVVVTEENLAVRSAYYLRIKSNAFGDQAESKYLVSTGTFTMTGIQLFLPTREPEIRETSVVLRYKTTEPTLSSIVLTPASGTTVTVALTSGDVSAGLKSVTGLVGGKTYSAELFAGTKSKGILSVTTLPVTNYTTIISTTDDLAATIAAAANGDVIGLNPGVYTLPAATTFITGKTITLKSTSGDPTNTKVNFKEIDLEGTGAGVTLSGIEFDGTTNAALYFLNFIGTQASNGAAATFTNVVVNNCIVHGAATAFLRADRGTAVNDHKITNITVSNSLVYECGNNGSSTYYTFSLNKIQFGSLNVTKSTFYNCGPGLVNAGTATSLVPSININYSTFNSFGGGSGKYIFLTAGANQVNFSMQNNIIANSPKATTVATTAINSTNVGSAITFSNNNTFGLVTAVGGSTAVTLPTGTANQTVDLGWTAATTNFTLPVGSALRTASSTGTAIGDPRWTY